MLELIESVFTVVTYLQHKEDQLPVTIVQIQKQPLTHVSNNTTMH